MQDIEFIRDLAVILAVAGAVGWVCQRIGLSVVAGFLVAGMVVGPRTPPFSLVTNEARIETAALASSEFADVRMQTVTLGEGGRGAGQTLREISPAQRFGVQIVGLKRRGARVLSPGAEETAQAGDELLLLGTPVKIREFKAWLEESPDE